MNSTKHLDVLARMPPDQIYLIPVRLDETQPNRPELAELHWVDLCVSYDQGIQKIIQAITRPNTFSEGKAHARLQGRSRIFAAISNLISPSQKKVESMRFMSRWNDAAAVPMRRALRDAISGSVCLEEVNQSDLMSALNFFEELAIAVSLKVVDEAVLRSYFGGIVSAAYQKLERWIFNRRARDNNSDYYRELERLRYRWSQ